MHGPWTVEDGGETVTAFVKARTGEAWSQVKRWVERGKIFVDGVAITDEAARTKKGNVIEVKLGAPRPRDETREGTLVYDDAHVVVIDKPAGISSVPYEERETGTAMDLIRGAWRRMGKPATSVALHVVHRIDRATSGLLMFAKSKRSERALAMQLRTHDVDRIYLCVAHGRVESRTIESRLVVDRGDGLRGSTRFAEQGKHSITHVRALEHLRGATRLEVQLETGRTHQIRIHLAESGHPLVGETVYIRDYAGKPIDSPRLLLHAATLGFAHPVTGEMIRLRSEPPPDFEAVVAKLRT
ncbi:MAG TPA: RluA family pseudouridine synthase [Kofleriaceae bacterium]|nr:RluA family pseudouridine synthase [Kofleriaceae bacterium]